ncbi:MAG: 6-carboxytetrahydropterin synthase [Bacteroidia bacterium]|nr:6-carboxytetrahydropterin synthase [Bacteroidia bacterium]MBP7261443.1 6-carboxytetrahydropterin synthase [Bacteroidia bacterium]MBP9181047.1 6-carboxytetrahydropterin synthase [Bacteroidia bacterium]MBP9724777.1 6-carboxytetrahydropterin synthase [Bacteroidia bacterium]
MKVSVTRKGHFNAAHRLHVAEWSEEKNKAFFGLCNNPNFHGHNYNLQVKVTGEVDPVSGYLIDMKLLSDIIHDEVEQRFDHRNLNLDTDEFKNLNPTAENIAIVIWQLIRKRLPQNLSLTITLYETERNFVEFSGE